MNRSWRFTLSTSPRVQLGEWIRDQVQDDTSNMFKLLFSLNYGHLPCNQFLRYIASLLAFFFTARCNVKTLCYSLYFFSCKSSKLSYSPLYSNKKEWRPLSSAFVATFPGAFTSACPPMPATSKLPFKNWVKFWAVLKTLERNLAHAADNFWLI